MNMRSSAIKFSLAGGIVILGALIFFYFTSSLSAIYLVQENDGSLSLKRDLIIGESDKLVFMLDFNGILNHLDRDKAYASHSPVLELSWDEDAGIGNVKEFRPDGTALSIAFSRFVEDGGRKPHGLFVGGDLPFGDAFRSGRMNTNGYGYYDGKDWYHIWCTANEGFSISGIGERTLNPGQWVYLGSKVIKNSDKEIIIESYHKAEIEGNHVMMQRRAIMRAGTGYFILKVSFTNAGDKPLMYGYYYGDEPWVGRFGASRGDVGWYEGGLITKETAMSPQRFGYAGYWDRGNMLAGEKPDFTGYANFIEWDNPVPSLVTFANSFDSCCDQSRPLADEDNRVILLSWLSQTLAPSETRTYTMAIGMAGVGERQGLPVKPEGIFE